MKRSELLILISMAVPIIVITFLLAERNSVKGYSSTDFMPVKIVIDSSPTSAPEVDDRCREPKQYITSQGDNIVDIAAEFGLRPQTILLANDFLLNDPSIVEMPGVEIRVPPADGYYYFWQEGDTLVEVAEAFAADLEDVVNCSFNEINPEKPEESLKAGEEIFLPGGFPPFQPG